VSPSPAPSPRKQRPEVGDAKSWKARGSKGAENEQKPSFTGIQLLGKFQQFL